VAVSDPVQDLVTALEATGKLISSIGDSSWHDPTPCTDWSVRDLVRHLIAGNLGFAGAVGGGSVPEPPAESSSDSELVAAYRGSASSLVEAFRQPGVLEKVVTVPFGSVPGAMALQLRITEVVVHGWDIATATGQAASFPEDLVEREIEFSRPLIEQIPPGRHPFAPPQPVSTGASAIDRLVALLGRKIPV
jgi:uncharacterized protein (TIGR03086 family)